MPYIMCLRDLGQESHAVYPKTWRRWSMVTPLVFRFFFLHHFLPLAASFSTLQYPLICFSLKLLTVLIPFFFFFLFKTVRQHILASAGDAKLWDCSVQSHWKPAIAHLSLHTSYKIHFRIAPATVLIFSLKLISIVNVNFFCWCFCFLKHQAAILNRNARCVLPYCSLRSSVGKALAANDII